MFDRIKQLLSQLKDTWAKLSKLQKAIVVGVSAAVLAVLVILVFWASNPQYVPLFSNLSTQDEYLVVTELKKAGEPYRLSADGKTVLVRADRVYELRLQMAAKGIPKSSVVGFEIFNKSQWGMTSFQEQVSYLRALRGELVRTISSLDPVVAAKVNIVMPKARLFVEQQKPATASVLVKLKPFSHLTPDQVRAIVNLVSHSVEGLSPDNVVVVDTKGEILSDMIKEDYILRSARKLSTVQIEVEKNYEQMLENRLVAMLNKVVGPGKAVAKVHVDFDFDKKNVKKEIYKPVVNGKGIVRSEQDIEERYKGTGTVPGGVPGTQSNIPGYQIPRSSGQKAEYSKSNVIKNYEITKEVEDVKGTPGKIKRISVAVLVDAKLKPQEVRKLRDSVAAAVGEDPARGDKVVVETIAFDTTYVKEMEAELAREERNRLILLLSILGAVALVMFLGYRAYRKKKLAEMEAAAAIEEEEEERKPEEEIPTLEEILSRAELSMEERERLISERQIREYADRHPDKIADLIRNWLMSD